MARKNNGDHGTGIPKHEIESLARCLLPAMQRFFESEENRMEFNLWRKQQDEKQKGKQNEKDQIRAG